MDGFEWPSHYPGVSVWANSVEHSEEIVETVITEQLDQYRACKQIARAYAAVGTEVTEVSVRIGASVVEMTFEEFEKLYGLDG